MAKLEKTWRVYWLPGSATERTAGAPLCLKLRATRLIVEVLSNSVTDFDTNAMQLKENEETRRLKHKTLPRNVNRDEHDARRIAHPQFRSRSRKTADHAHRPRAGTHGVKPGGERTISSYQAHQFHNMRKYMSEDGVEGSLVVARGANRPTDRTRPKGEQSRTRCATH